MKPANPTGSPEALRPLILVGVGRSGSTALHRALARHPRLAWLSVFANWVPSVPLVNRALMAGLDTPGLGGYLRRRLNPAEAYPFWERRSPGFSDPRHDLTAADLDPAAAAHLRTTFAAMRTRQRDRLLLKLTGWPRLGYLRALFPDARFVHLVRDGRAVAYSLMQVDWWRGHDGPEGWRLGPLTPEHDALWAAHGRSTTALAGLYWVRLLDAMDAARADLPDDAFRTIRYEELCAHPDAVLADLLAFAGLDPDPALTRHVAAHPFRNTNDKWRTLPPAEQATLDAVTRAPRERYGYV